MTASFFICFEDFSKRQQKAPVTQVALLSEKMGRKNRES